MADIDDIRRLDHMKGFWGWGLAASWIVYWWWELDKTRRFALSQPCPEGLASQVGDFFFGEGQSCLNSINGDFNSGLLFAIITSPVGFIVAHYIATWRLSQLKAREQALDADNEQKRRAAHEASLADMQRRSRIDQRSTRESGDRYEIITRLGAVDDQLVVLDNETAPETIKLIKLNIGQSIRDIHAKFKDDELRSLYRRDEGVRQRVDRTLAEMTRLNMGDSRLYADLAEIFISSGVSTTGGPDAIVLG